MDTLLTIILIIACIVMIALTAMLIYDISREFIEGKKAAKRREELIKKWANIDLSKPCIYIDTDATYNKGCYTYNFNVWHKMRGSCVYSEKNLHAGKCRYPDNDGLYYCKYETCPLLHARTESGCDE